MTKDSKVDAWMPLYVGDWDGDTGHLDCEQDGAYGRIVRWYWRNGPPPDDDAALARIVRMDLKRWRKIRSIISAFFVVKEGRWTHRRVDAELERWSEKKRAYAERASAGGRAKAAKSSASSSASSSAKSTPKAVLKTCTSSSSTEVEAPHRASTLSGRKAGLRDAEAPPPCAWSGPEDWREAFVAAKGEAWTASYIDPCQWQQVPTPALVARNGIAAGAIKRDARAVLAALGLVVLERAA